MAAPRTKCLGPPALDPGETINKDVGRPGEGTGQDSGLLLWADLRAKAQWLYGSADAKSILRALASDGSLSMLLYRAMAFCAARRAMRPLAAVFCKLNGVLCGAVIGLDARFARGFVILHSQGVVINGKVAGGREIYVESGVVIGESRRKCPVLANCIFIGSGAKVFGGVTVGSNVTIGANAVVNKDLPDNVVAAGVPARVVRQKETGESLVP